MRRFLKLLLSIMSLITICSINLFAQIDSIEVVPSSGFDKPQQINKELNVFNGIDLTSKTIISDFNIGLDGQFFNNVFDIDTLKNSLPIIVVVSDSGIYSIETHIKYVPYKEKILPKLDTLIFIPISKEIVDGYRIHSDQKGNIWVATSKGLEMYNGTNWTIFNKTTDIPDDSVLSISSNKDNTLLVTTHKQCYQIKDGIVSLYPLYTNTNIDSILCGVFYDTTMLVGTTDGVYYYENSWILFDFFKDSSMTLPPFFESKSIRAATKDIFIHSDGSIYFSPLNNYREEDNYSYSIIKLENITSFPFFIKLNNIKADPSYSNPGFFEELPIIDCDPIGKLSIFDYNGVRCYVILTRSDYGDLVSFFLNDVDKQTGYAYSYYNTWDDFFDPNPVANAKQNFFFMKDFTWSNSRNGSLNLTFNDRYNENTGILNNELDIDNFTLNIYPNPFNEILKINFSLQKKTNVSIDIFNRNEKKITTVLYNETLETGKYNREVIFPSGLEPGVYFVRIQAFGKTIFRTITFSTNNTKIK